MTQKFKDILFVAGLLISIGMVFLGIWAGDEFHNVWYGLIPLGIGCFAGLIYGKNASSKKTS